ncbi:hypothetical protein [Leptospira bouyouniensis]|uniref:hypothetical protein n=1 Tax=Leptospira bouyouniensis TaxID=2484911 RepID=UPI00109107D6|nr:hypothetical protein [Leptospira bouyouniensis]TGM74354.1 hypothetical protein EHQ99_19085 [Leptospira bouyouniensis]
MEINYTIHITGPETDLKKTVDKETGEEIIILALKGFKAIKNESNQQKKNPSAKPAQSLREVLNTKNARNIAAKIVATGIYLKNTEGKQYFTIDDIKTNFPKAGEPLPKNLSRDIKSTLQLAWISPSNDNESEYYVTNTGEEQFDNSFPEAKKGSAKLKRKKNNKAAKKKRTE